MTVTPAGQEGMGDDPHRAGGIQKPYYVGGDGRADTATQRQGKIFGGKKP